MVDGATDGALAGAMLAGDEDAFAGLYDRHARGVHDFVLRIVRDPGDAQDVTQATFVRLYERRDGLREPEKVRSWIFAVANNLALNHVSRARVTEPVEEQWDLAAPGRGPEGEAVTRDVAELVWDAAASLEPRQYAVLDLSVRRELSTPEIAEVLGVPAAHAAVLVNRARAALGNAVRYLMVARRRDHCERLAQLIPAGFRALTPEQRTTVDHHMRHCENCQVMAKRLTAPAELLGGLIAVPLPPHLAQWPGPSSGGGWHLTAVRRGRHGRGGRVGRRLTDLMRTHRGMVVAVAATAAVGGSAAVAVITLRHSTPGTVSGSTSGTRNTTGEVNTLPGPITSIPPSSPTTVKTFEPWERNAASGEAAPRDGLVVTSRTGTCDGGAQADPGRPAALRCLTADGVRINTCFAPPPQLTLPAPAVLCSTDPTSNQVTLLSITQPLPVNNVNSESNADPWFLVLSNGLKCARAGSGTNTDVLSYFCNNGTLVTAPDRLKATWTVQEGTFQNAVPILSSIPVAVNEAYR